MPHHDSALKSQLNNTNNLHKAFASCKILLKVMKYIYSDLNDSQQHRLKYDVIEYSTDDLAFKADGNFIDSIFRPASWWLSNTISVDFYHQFLLGY